MRELTFNEINVVSGGLTWRDRRQSDNVIDLRSGYAHTNRSFGVDFLDVKVHYEQTGTLLNVRTDREIEKEKERRFVWR